MNTALFLTGTIFLLCSLYEIIDCKPQGCIGLRWRPCNKAMNSQMSYKRNLLRYADTLDNLMDEEKRSLLDDENMTADEQIILERFALQLEKLKNQQQEKQQQQTSMKKTIQEILKG